MSTEIIDGDIILDCPYCINLGRKPKYELCKICNKRGRITLQRLIAQITTDIENLNYNAGIVRQEDQ